MTNNIMLGNVQYSILEPDDFKTVNGNGWVLMDGRDIQGSELFKLNGMANVPDARGVFIRSMNCPNGVEDMSQKGDTQIDRPVGSYQKDSFELHSHSITNLGFFQALLPHESWAGAEMTQFNAGQGLKDIHTMLRNDNTGGNETRPRNIALYLYIKINN